MVVLNTSQRPDITGRDYIMFLITISLILSVGFINPLVQIIPSNDEFV